MEERWRPRVVTDGPSLDHAGAHRAAVDLLAALGLDLTVEHLARRPQTRERLTSALFGLLRDDARGRAECLDLTRGRL